MPPVAFNSSDQSSTSISLTWHEISPPYRNGIIKGYEITYEEEGTINETKTSVIGAGVLSATFYDLLPYTYYEFTLHGFTSKGNGVKGHLRIRTAEGSKNR